MKCSFKLTIPLTVLLVGFFIANRSVAEQEPATDANKQEAKHFTLKVLPLLKEKCLGCHGVDADDLKGDYDMRSREVLIAGGESEEAAIIPGKPDESPLYQAVMWEGLEMPPKENDRLTEQQTEMIRHWIEVGAPWPSEEEQAEIKKAEWSVAENDDGVLVSTSGGLADEWTYRRYQKEDVWAFRSVQKSFDHNSIDAFVNAKLDDADITPAPLASPAELLRRATFDLIGLPPTPKERTDFLAAWEQDSEKAWGDLIDRLLASTHYGERWGQHWLDVVRYADTAGFSNDYERSNAWRYRDYVIRSFNSDKPFDLFVKEQIAGDELRPEDPEAIVATGFLRMGAWGTAMIPDDEARQLYRDDVVHSIGQSFLSMPMRCCKCHDHKFDPIPTQDYYRLYATISATQPAEMPAEFLPEENQNRFEETKEFVEKLWDYSHTKRNLLYEKRETAARKWYDENNLPYKGENERKNDPEDMKPIRHVGLTETEQGRLKVREQDTWIWERRRERTEALAQSVFNGPDLGQNSKKLRKPAKPKPKDVDWKPESVIFLGGSYMAKGDPVTPGVLSGCGLPVEGAPTDDPFAITTDINGRRLALANWIANPENPLTARSYVNRIWQYHFGNGIVRTANNFGVKGANPTHLELLDWMTQDFLAGGWKTKRLHRQIMMSDAYRRSTVHPDQNKLDTVDSENKLLARFLPRRLTAEEVRDGLLAITGELNREAGGLPIVPEINLEVALEPRMIQFSIAPAQQPSRTPAERNRRSIYAYRVRGQADPFLEVLNKPNPNDSCDFRDTAAVSPQAFTLFNSDLMSDRSIALAQRVEKSAAETGGQIGRAFQLTLGRKPTAAERNRLVKYVDEMTAYHKQNEPEPVTFPTEITRSLVEEFTGKEFTYVEWLPVFENYVPDAKPDTVSPRTRAMADMCLLLFNANEFMYVY
ncbi:MAG: PSD1 and planctomycete cytochrome C domain-containing protein [Pirellulaceae bacterium]